MPLDTSPNVIASADVKMLPTFREQVNASLWHFLRKQGWLYRWHGEQELKLWPERVDMRDKFSVHMLAGEYRSDR